MKPNSESVQLCTPSPVRYIQVDGEYYSSGVSHWIYYKYDLNELDEDGDTQRHWIDMNLNPENTNYGKANKTHTPYPPNFLFYKELI